MTLTPHAHPTTRSYLQRFAWYALLENTRKRLRLHALLQAMALSLSSGAFAALLVGLLANLHPPTAWALLATCLIGMACLLMGSLLRAFRSSTHARAARHLASCLPSFGLDFLCAWELALHPFHAENAEASPILIHAFWENLDIRLHNHRPLLTSAPTLPPKGLLPLGIGLGLCAFLGLYFGSAWKTGVEKMRGKPNAAEPLSAEPIAGEFWMRYRFPEYTGLGERVVLNSNGEINVLQGTTIEWEAKADRKIKQAQLRINGQTLPLEVLDNRKLRGNWVASSSGNYYIEFLNQGKLSAQSPPFPLHVEMDKPPHVRLLSPESPLNLAPEENQVVLRFEAGDDFGLSALELRYFVENQPAQTLPMPAPQARFVQEEFLWDLGPLALLPGQSVHYMLVARDNDLPAGKKEGLSSTQTLQKWSQAMHQKMAIEKSKRAWKQLLAHAANRLESGEMSPKASSKTTPSKHVLDEQAKEVATALAQCAKEILQEALAPKPLAAAFENASQTLRRMAFNTAKARQKSTETQNPEFLFKALVAEVLSAEHHLLYLEDLMEEFRLHALAELSKLLKTQLAELKTLLSQHSLATETTQKNALLAQVQKRKNSIVELLGRMAEMSTTEENAVHEEVDWSAYFQNEAQHTMASLETALSSGHMEEALRQTEAMLSQMDNNAHALSTNPPQHAQNHAALSEEFGNFRQALEAVLEEQEALLQKTQALYEKQRQKTAEALAQKTRAARPMLEAHLEELHAKLKNLSLERMSVPDQNLREKALEDLEMVKSTLASNEASLASEIARELVQKTDELAAASKRQENLDRALGNSPEERQRSKETREASLEGAEKARDLQERLRSLLGHKSGIAAEGDTTGIAQSVSEQEALGKRTREIQQHMEELSEKAPLFDEETKNNLEKTARHMEQAANRLRLGNAKEGQSQQAQAVQGLQSLKQQLQAGGLAQTTLPMPSASGKLGQGTAQNPKPLLLPKTSTSQPHFRKKLLETMRQAVPEGYAEPVRRYYEELIK
ncbi:MAG: hypothetical protein FWG75_05085 [Cystobacterineae bacterium]|nr:hypothetical protein [Cystobacterineae bacterium]